MDFAAPHWLWLLLAVPAAALAAGIAWRRRLDATAAWAARSLWDRLLPAYDARRLVAWNLALAVALAAVALTLARPRWGATEEQVERRGVDVVFVLDTSLSMATRDLHPSRLWVAQTLIRRLVRALPGHRVALVQAEGDGVVRVPLTADAAVIDLLLDAVLPGSLPKPGTELEPALERALGLFGESGEKHRALILVSDGEDHGSGLDSIGPELAEAGVVVHTVGVGTPEGRPLELPGRRPGAPMEYKRDADGNVVVSRLREETLERLSRETGGLYLHAESAATDPAPLVQRIEAMDKRSYGTEVVSTLEERFQWPAGVAVLALVLHLSISPFRRTENPSSKGASRKSLPVSVASMLFVLSASPAAAAAPGWLERLLFNPVERTERAIESFERGDASGAVGPLETALRLAGDDPAARYNAGTGRLAAGTGDAETLLESAAESGPDPLISVARYNLGNAHFARGDLPGAIAAYRRALRSDPSFEDAKFNLELAQRRLEAQQRQERQQQQPESGGSEQDEPQDPRGREQPRPGSDGDEQSQGQDPPQEQGARPGDDPRGGPPPGQGPPDSPSRDRSRERPSPLPQFRDLPDMTAEEAAAILEAIENAEREERRRQAAEAAASNARGRKDW